MNKDLDVTQLVSKGLAQLSSGLRTLSKAVEKLPPLETLMRLLTGEQGEVFTCGHCEYTTTRRTDYKKHLNTLKHMRQLARKIEPGSSVWAQIKQDYSELKQEDDKYVLMAYMWLQPHHRRVGVGKQGMGKWPLRELWEVVHNCMFDGGFYMKGNKLSIYSKTMPRDKFNFDVFTQFREHAHLVIMEANPLIDIRARLFAEHSYNDPWEKYQYSVRNLPMYLKDKTPIQKRKETCSLHEYLQMCG